MLIGRLSRLHIKATKSSGMTINILKFQMAVVYIFAGISKIKLRLAFGAQPLRNQIKHQTDSPFIGELMQYEIYGLPIQLGGALLDLFIVFILLNNRFRIYWLYIGHYISWPNRSHMFQLAYFHMS